MKFWDDGGKFLDGAGYVRVSQVPLGKVCELRQENARVGDFTGPKVRTLAYHVKHES